MENEDLYVYKKSDFYEDYISSQKEYYEREQVDTLLNEKDREIALLKERICNGDVSRATWIDDCLDKDKEIAELKQKLGAVNELVKELKELLKESQKMHQRCADNASKQIRRLKRALYKACANWAGEVDRFEDSPNERWSEMKYKCRAMADKWR